MGDKYNEARLGHIWLGEASQRSNIAMLKPRKIYYGDNFEDLKIDGRALSRYHCLSFAGFYSKAVVDCNLDTSHNWNLLFHRG